MWDILTGWLFNDGTQLRVPLWLFVSDYVCVTMFVCFHSVISLINKPGLTQGHGEEGNTRQGPSGGLDIRSELLKIVCTIQTWKYLKEITFSVNRHHPTFKQQV